MYICITCRTRIYDYSSLYTRTTPATACSRFLWNFEGKPYFGVLAKYRQVRIDVRAMGDAAMNVAASGSGGGGAGGSGQRIVKEGWLQKRGTANDVFIIFTFCVMFARRHVPNCRTLLFTLLNERTYVMRGTSVTTACFELSSSTRCKKRYRTSKARIFRLLIPVIIKDARETPTRNENLSRVSRVTFA